MLDVEFALLAKENPVEWEKQAKQLADMKSLTPFAKLYRFSMEQIQLGGDLAAGIKIIDMGLAAAAESEEEANITYMGAEFYGMAKDYKKAIALLDKVLVLLPKSYLKDNAAFKKRVEDVKAHYSRLRGS